MSIGTIIVMLVMLFLGYAVGYEARERDNDK